MTRYFYDTEFLEDGSTIELISIGIVCEDGREYYAVVADADWARIHQSEWLTENVIPQLPKDQRLWKPKAKIAEEVRRFLLRNGPVELWAYYSAYDHVALAQLWGPMIGLPKGIPMFTNDIRSLVSWLNQPTAHLPKQEEGQHDALEDARHNQRVWNYLSLLAR